MNAKAGSFGMLNISSTTYTLDTSAFTVPNIIGSQYCYVEESGLEANLEMEFSPFYLGLSEENTYNYQSGETEQVTITKHNSERLSDGALELIYYNKYHTNTPYYADYNYNAIQTNGGIRMFAYNQGTTSAISNAETRILINPRADNNGEAISVKQGMFGGFRPRTRIANNGTMALTESDSVIVCQGAHTLILPDNAGMGQMYTIIKTGD